MLNLTITRQSTGGNELLDALIHRLYTADEVGLSLVEWGELWSVLRNAVVQKRGCEVAEVGTTWLGSLAGMNGLRPFNDADIAKLDGTRAFVPIAWEHSRVAGDNRTWAVPLTLDSRAIFFWSDMLEATGIDPATAFSTPEQVHITFQRLQSAGVAAPWTVPMHPGYLTAQHMASWLWQSGGEFLSADGKHIALLEPAALRGMAEYFRLKCYTAPDELPDESRTIQRFLRRETAAIMAGSWLLNSFSGAGMHEVPEALGVALPPGPSFVGGTSLVVMNHVAPRDERLAMALVKLLTTPDFQAEYCRMNAHIPARVEALNTEFYAQNRHYRVFIQALESGRILSGISRWSIVEDRLREVFAEIWADMNARPNEPVENLLTQRLEPVIKRLDMTLAQ